MMRRKPPIAVFGFLEELSVLAPVGSKARLSLTPCFLFHDLLLFFVNQFSVAWFRSTGLRILALFNNFLIVSSVY